VEEAGEEGRVDEAQSLTEQVEKMQQELQHLKDNDDVNPIFRQENKMEVCHKQRGERSSGPRGRHHHEGGPQRDHFSDSRGDRFRDSRGYRDQPYRRDDRRDRDRSDRGGGGGGGAGGGGGGGDRDRDRRDRDRDR
ncbi:hypothetical protein BGW38_010211, partial [Lunasporangiospora selenospora]